jgi:hypothetical protein
MRSMIFYRKAAVERAMKVQEVILRAMAKKITWWQAAEIIVIKRLTDKLKALFVRYEFLGDSGVLA